MTKRAAPSATDDAARWFLITREFDLKDCRPSSDWTASASNSPRNKQQELRMVVWISRHLPRHRRRLRRSQSICRDIGAGCATPKAFAAASAQVAPLSKHLPRRLRRLRNSQSICRDVCAGCATPKAFAATAAQVAPIPKHLPRQRRRLRNSQSICRDVCAGCATPKAFAATSAQLRRYAKASPL